MKSASQLKEYKNFISQKEIFSSTIVLLFLFSPIIIFLLNSPHFFHYINKFTGPFHHFYIYDLLLLYFIFLVIAIYKPLLSFAIFLFLLPIITRLFYNSPYEQLKQLPTLILCSIILFGSIVKFSKDFKFKLIDPLFFSIINLYLFSIILSSGFSSIETFSVSYSIFLEVNFTYIFITNLYLIFKEDLVLLVFRVLSIVGFLYSAIGIILVLNGPKVAVMGFRKTTYIVLSEGILRITSIFPNANMFGMLLIFSIPSCIVLFFLQKKKTTKVLLFLNILLMTGNLLLTFSRSSILAVAISIILLSYSKLSKKKFLYLILILIGVFLAILIVLHSYFPLLYKALIERKLAGRYSLWKTAWNLFSEHPLIGIGFGNWFLMSGKSLRVHNVFLNTFVETGIMSGVMLIFMYILLFVKFSLKNFTIHINNPFLITVFSIVVASIFQQFFESYTLGFGGPEFTSYYFIVFFFLSISILREERNEKKVS